MADESEIYSVKLNTANFKAIVNTNSMTCLLYTSDAADE